MSKQIFIPRYNSDGTVEWFTYDATGNLIPTIAPTNQDINAIPSTLEFEYSVAGECFKRVVTECLDCTDGVWDTSTCFDQAGELVTCPDFTDPDAYEKGCLCETCTSSGTAGFDFTGVVRTCTKVNFDTNNNAFLAVCPNGWSTQDLVDELNSGNPNGAVFGLDPGNSEVIIVLSGTAPTSIWLVSTNPQVEVTMSDGGEEIKAQRVKDCNSDEQTTLLQEIADNTCPSTVTSSVLCNTTAATVNLVSGGTTNLTAGQEILLGEVYDCNGNLQSFSLNVLLLGVLEEIADAIDTGTCPTTPEVTPAGCVKDAAGQEWNVFSTTLNGDTVTYYQDAITGTVGTPKGDPSDWTGCGEDSCGPVDRHCFCVVSQGKTKGETKSESKTASKEKESSPGKILSVCRLRWWDCAGNIILTQYEYQGRILSQEKFEAANLKEVDCSSPDVSYIKGATTCATTDHDDDPLTPDIVLNCSEFVNATDPTDIFVQYTLAADYTTLGLGTIGDIFEPTTGLTVVACAPGSITEAQECYEALVDIKGIASQGDTITVDTVTNSIAGTTFYTITHTSSSSVIYTGTDPLGDIGLDLGDAATWDGPTDCDVVVETPGCCPVVQEACMLVDGTLSTVIYSIYPDTGQILWIRDVITGSSQTVPKKGWPEFVDCCSTGFVACMQFGGFDGQMTQDLSDPDLSGSFDVGDPSIFDVDINGTSTAVVVDYLATSDNVNQSTWYTTLTNFINSNSNFTISVVQDVNVEVNAKVLWQIDYSGPGNETMTIVKNGGDIYTYSVDGSGNMTVTITDDQGDPFNSPVIIQSC